MIDVGGLNIPLDDPLVLLAGGLILTVVVLLLATVRAARRSARMADPVLRQLGAMGQQIHQLHLSQEQMRGGLQTVSDTQVHAQAQMIQAVEARMSSVQQNMQDRLADNALRSNRALAEMQERMKESLHGSSKQTTTSLTQLQERLAVIDRAQDNITKLSGDVLSLQDILSNKQTRGAFGEIQLRDIVSKALPADGYEMQYTLSNGKRADCIVHLPNPPGPIVIDSKFPLEAYEALRAAQSERDMKAAAAGFRSSVAKHIADISERYILEGETADGALMFLPSEAVYAELHASFPEIVRKGFDARVWIVSPTTCMATLNTMRAILKDARMREQAGAIRAMLRQLHRDVELVVERSGKLETHFRQARADLDGITTAAERAGKRAMRLDAFDFEKEPEDTSAVVSLSKPAE